MNDDSLISLQPGTVIASKYEVVKCLGAGSMGLVYACRHRELAGHMVAVKVLFPEVAQDKIAAARFRNEIFASYGVSHPNVVRAYEYLRDGDLIAYTMEFVGGGDLADRLSRGGDLISIPDCIKILSQMCSGVQAIHDAGIVHRDLKPENILLTKDGSVKIADFGIARTGHGPKLTEHGGVVGTIDYVSPEYMLNSQVDWRSDIYAIGILAYEMVTGESPFRGDSVYATMTKRLKSDPAMPGTIRDDCPPELDKIILKAMARNPEERYQTASQMFYDLQNFASSRGYALNSIMNFGQPGKNYQGPVVNSGDNARDNSAIAAALGSASNSSSDSERDHKSFFMEQNDSEHPVEERNAFIDAGPFELEDNFIEESNFENETTEVLNSELASISSGYSQDPTLNDAPRLERLLMRQGDNSSDWDKPQSGTIKKVNINTSGIDNDRVQRLSQVIYRASRSIWVDILILLVAVMIGIGAGFTLLKFTWPELMSGNKPTFEEEAEKNLINFEKR